jgi:hypothetical protein
MSRGALHMCGVSFPLLKERFKGFVSQWVEFPLRAREKMVKK